MLRSPSTYALECLASVQRDCPVLQEQAFSFARWGSLILASGARVARSADDAACAMQLARGQKVTNGTDAGDRVAM